MKKTAYFLITIVLIFSSSYSTTGAAGIEFEEINEFNDYIIELEGESMVQKKANLSVPGFEILQQVEMFQHAKNLENRRIHVKNQIEEQTITREFEYLFNGMVIKNISKSEAESIENIKGVKKVWVDEKVEISLTASVPLIQEGIVAGKVDIYGDDCDVSGKACLTGEGVKIAILDTGVDYTHADFGGCTTEEFLNKECERVIGGWDFIAENDDPMDEHGHGTHVASIAVGNDARKGAAPEAKILVYRVLNDKGSGTIGGVVAGIEKAVEDGADILNMSLGGSPPYGDPLSVAADNAVLEGAIVVVSAGNSGPDSYTIRSPGRARKAITVGATDKNDILADFSSRGPVVWEEEEIMKPDLVAPGVSIQAARWGGGYTFKSGTSMSAPHVAGVVALLKQRSPELSPDEIKEILKASAIDLGYEEKEQGTGRIDVRKAVKMAQEYTITIEKDGGGTVTKDPEKESYEFEEEVLLTAEPEENWIFSHWSGDVDSTKNPLTVLMDSNKNIEAHFLEEKYILTIDIEGEGIVNIAPEKLAYVQDELVDIEAIPAQGWSFSHWSGDLTSSDNPETVTMDDDKTITAHFTQDEYTLTINMEGEGSVNKLPDQETYTFNNEVELTAVAVENGWSFSHWTGDLTGSINPKTIKMDGNKTVTVHFSENEHSITVNVTGEGSVLKDPDKATYAFEDEVNITAIPEPGWEFSHWEGEEGLIDDEEAATTFLTMPDSDIEITANFIEGQYTLTVDINDETRGVVIIEPEKEIYSYNEEVTITAEEEEEWFFSHWSGDFEGTENPATIKMDGNKIITANFDEETAVFNYREVTFNKNGGDTEADPAVMSVTEGESVGELPIPPTRTGYTFTSWNTEANGSGSEFTGETPVTEDITVYAIWTANEYTVTFDARGGTTPNPETKQVTFNEEYGTLASTSRSGYTFSGWFTATSGGTKIEENTIVSITDDHTLYAQWTADSPPPSGGGGGGGGSVAPPPEEEDEEEDLDEGEDEEEETKEEAEPEKETEETLEAEFTDTEGHWGEAYIKTLSEKCGVQGYTDEDGNLLNLFGPNNPVTRAELVKMVVGCIEGETPEDGETPFTDVEEGKWYNPYIFFAVTEGWIEGYADGTFRPGNNINRVEALKIILLSTYTEEEIAQHEYEEEEVYFEDTRPDQWYSPYLGFAVSKGFVSGYTDAEGNPTGYFGPSNNLTRAEAAKIIAEALGM